MSSPSAETQSPPIENLLVTVLVPWATQAFAKGSAAAKEGWKALFYMPCCSCCLLHLHKDVCCGYYLLLSVYCKCLRSWYSK